MTLFLTLNFHLLYPNKLTVLYILIILLKNEIIQIPYRARIVNAARNQFNASLGDLVRPPGDYTMIRNALLRGSLHTNNYTN